MLSEEEQMVFLEYAKGSPYEDVYLIALATGMRIAPEPLWAESHFPELLSQKCDVEHEETHAQTILHGN